MKRLAFTHVMLGKTLLGEKVETRRRPKIMRGDVRGKEQARQQPGGWLLASSNFWKELRSIYDPVEDWYTHKSTEFSPADYDRMAQLVRRAAFASAAKGINSAPEDVTSQPEVWKCAPSIHMPTWLCQCALLVTGVRIERLGDIDEAGAKREGFARRDDFMRYFNQLNPTAHTNDIVEVIQYEMYNMDTAQQMGGLDSLVLRQKAHWPEGWRDHVPNWMQQLRVETEKETRPWN